MTPVQRFLVLTCFLAGCGLFAQQPPLGKPSSAVSESSTITRCIEQSDVAACQRALKWRLTSQRRSEVLTFLLDAQLSCGQDEDLKNLNEAIRLNPKNALAHFLKARSLECQGDALGAVPSYLKAIELHPEWARYYVNVGEILNRYQGGSEQAIQVWRRAIESEPDNPRALAGYGTALRVSKQPAAAVPVLQKAIELDPTLSSAQGDLCLVLVGAKALTELRPVCEKAIELGTGLPLREIGAALEGAGEFMLAEKAYRRGLTTDAFNAEYFVHDAARVLSKQQKNTEIIELYRSYFPRDATDWRSTELHVEMIEKAGDVGFAEQILIEAARRDSVCTNSRALGDLYARHERLPEAIVQYKKAVEMQTDCPGAIYGLRKAYAAHGGNPAELAEFEAQQLAKQRPAMERPDLYTAYARILHVFGRTEDALAAYHKAVELDKSTINSLGALAEYLRELQRYDEAIAVFEEARRRMPEAFEANGWIKQQYASTLAAMKRTKP